MNKSTFTKISGIFSTLMVAFAMTANAQQVTVVDDTIMVYNGNAAFDNNIASSFEKLYLSSDQRAAIKKVVVKGIFQSDNVFSNTNDFGVETLDLSEAVLPQWYSFKNLGHLKNVIWPTAGTFIIPDGAFQTNSSEWTTVNIPTNCTEIQADAFTKHSLKSITITGPSTIIRARAFENCDSVKDVYVISGEETYVANGDTLYYCEKTAFDFDITWAQTQIDCVDEVAILHIPSDAKNLDNFRIPNVDVLTQAVLCSTYHESSKNGWHEFIKNSESIVASDQAFRTFSDTKEHLFPACKDINQGVKIYYVVGIKNIDGVDKVLLEPLNENADYLLPANTGVLMYTKKGVVVYNTDKESGAQKISQFGARTPLGNKNYLEELQSFSDNTFMSWSSTIDGEKYVNLFLNNKKDVDPSPKEWGFYTIKKKVYAKSETCYRAYLSVPRGSFDNTTSFGLSYGTGDAEPSLDINECKVLSLDEDDLDEETTMIVTTKITDDQSSEDNSYYNMNGQKINNPTKGFYIHAGKKYIK